MKRLLLAMLVAFGVLAAPARGEYVHNLIADATNDQGWIEVGMVASQELTQVTVGELVDGVIENERPFPLLPFPNYFPDHGGLQGGTIKRAFKWRCDRADRTLISRAQDPQGNVVTGTFQVRTPSCRHRLAVDVPLERRPGQPVRVKLRDTWTIGEFDAEVCRRAPDVEPRCRTVRFAENQQRASSSFTPRARARWTVTVAAPLQRIVRPVNVGVEPRPEDLEILPTVLATGDSLMQGLDDILSDDLTGRADVPGDVLIGSGLTSDLIQDWDRVPQRQIKREDPEAVVVFLGANDSYEMTTPAGEKLTCCSVPWSQEYARRARKVMRTYTRSGARVFYLTVPLARDPDRNVPGAAVNAGLYAAAEGQRGVHIIDTVSLFTPGGVWREHLDYKGRTVDVYQDDGIHLSIAGAKIASEVIVRALLRRGVI